MVPRPLLEKGNTQLDWPQVRPGRPQRMAARPHVRRMTRAGVDMQGVAVTLLDTAGLRSAADAVERIGVARARAAAAAADVVVLVYDAQVPPRSAWPLLQVLLRTQSNVIVQSSAGPVAASWRVHPAPGSLAPTAAACYVSLYAHFVNALAHALFPTCQAPHSPASLHLLAILDLEVSAFEGLCTCAPGRLDG